MIPKHLKLQNFLSHDVSEIDFDTFNVALILGTYDNESDQSNGAGKSAVFEAVTWALFGRSRHKKKDGVVKWDKRACRVEFSFWIEDDLYKVTRTRDKIIGESDVIFEHFDGVKFVSIDCDTNTATDKKIIDTINVNYEVFVNSVYFKQDDISIFATTTPSKRKDVLKALLKMSKWDAYQKKTKEKTRQLETKIEEKSQQLVPMLDLDIELNVCKDSLASLKSTIKAGNKLYTATNAELISKKSKYQSTYADAENDIGKLKKLQREWSDTKKRLSGAENTVKQNNQTISTSSTKISGLQQNMSVFKEHIKDKKKINIELFRSKMIDGRTKENLLAEQVTNLKKEIKLVDNCDLCKKPLTKKEIISLKEQHKADLLNTQQKYKDIKIKVAKATRSLQDKEQIVTAGNKAEIDKGKAEAKISKLQNEIDSCIASSAQIAIEQEGLLARDFEGLISKLKEHCDKDKEEILKNEIIELDSSVRTMKRNGDKLNIEYGSKIRRRDEIIKLQRDQAVLQNTINKLKNEFSVYDKLRGYFGKDGIQAIIIENVIEELENYANEILAMICNESTSISIKTQKQNDNGSWAETFDILVKAGARTDDFDTFSGGEKFRISLALRLALSNILSTRMGGEIKFLLLDEVSSNLDNKGLNMFIDIVKQLSTDIKILVITHNERLKERFEDIIMVDKGPTGSRIVMN